MINDPEYQRVLQTVSKWPLSRRASLAAEMLATLKPVNDRMRRPTLNRALGLARVEGAAPSDADVDRWMDEHRREKYGA
jgi:hypothetical protein